MKHTLNMSLTWDDQTNEVYDDQGKNFNYNSLIRGDDYLDSRFKSFKNDLINNNQVEKKPKPYGGSPKRYSMQIYKNHIKDPNYRWQLENRDFKEGSTGGEAVFNRVLSLIIEKEGPNANLNWMDVSNVTDMYAAFYASPFNGDISKWDVSNVTDMTHMFGACQFNGDISNWDVSNVKKMDFMFSGSYFNGDISNWDVSNVKSMWGMFEWAHKFNSDISKWDVSNVVYMRDMFEHSIFNGDISNWDVSNVRNMDHMFFESKFNQDISRWNVPEDAYIDRIFKDCPLENNPPQWFINHNKNLKEPEIYMGQPVGIDLGDYEYRENVVRRKQTSYEHKYKNRLNERAQLSKDVKILLNK